MSEESIWERFNEGKLDRRTFVRIASLLGGAAVFGLPLAGCQPAAAPAPTPTKAPPAAPSPTKPPAPTPTATARPAFEIKGAAPAPMLQVTATYTGDKLGAFLLEGVKNAWTEFAGGADQVRAVVTGGYHVGIVSPTAAMAAYEAGEPARLIAGGFLASGVGFVVKADSPIKSPQDIKGKKIGYSRPNSNSHIVAILGVKAAGIDPKDVQLVSTGSNADTWTAVKTGIIDVGWTTEPIATKVEKDREGRILWWTWDLVPDWVDVGVMTTKGLIDSNPKELQGWVNAHVKSTEWVKNNKAEAAKILAETLKFDLDIAEAALKKIPDRIWNVALPKKAIQVMVDSSVEFKLLKGTVNLKEFVDQRFLPANLRETY